MFIRLILLFYIAVLLIIVCTAYSEPEEQSCIITVWDVKIDPNKYETIYCQALEKLGTNVVIYKSLDGGKLV